MRHLSFEEWFDNYEPIMGEDGEHLKDFDPKTIDSDEDNKLFDRSAEDNKLWTLVDTETGLVIINGFHFVNKMQVFITKKSYETQEIIEVKY